MKGKVLLVEDLVKRLLELRVLKYVFWCWNFVIVCVCCYLEIIIFKRS